MFTFRNISEHIILQDGRGQLLVVNEDALDLGDDGVDESLLVQFGGNVHNVQDNRKGVQLVDDLEVGCQLSWSRPGV